MDPLRTRYAAVAAMYAGAAVMPAGCVLFLLYPDWSLMYLANSAHIPLLLSLPLVLGGLVSAPLLGFVAAWLLLVRKAERGLRRLVWGTGLAALAVLVLGHEALFSVAYYDNFHYGGERVGLFRSPLIIALAVIAPALAFAYVFSALQIRRHVRAIQSALVGSETERPHRSAPPAPAPAPQP